MSSSSKERLSGITAIANIDRTKEIYYLWFSFIFTSSTFFPHSGLGGHDETLQRSPHLLETPAAIGTNRSENENAMNTAMFCKSNDYDGSAARYTQSKRSS